MKEKLVRDKIPQIIEDSGRKPITRVASRSEMHKYLFEKIKEEFLEFDKDPCVEEAADIYSVLVSLCSCNEIRMSDVLKKSSEKYEERGGFSSGIILLDVE